VQYSIQYRNILMNNKLIDYGLSMLIEKGRTAQSTKVQVVSATSTGAPVQSQVSMVVKPKFSPNVGVVFGTEAGRMEWTDTQLKAIETKAQELVTAAYASVPGGANVVISLTRLEQAVVNFVEAEIVPANVIADLKTAGDAASVIAGEAAQTAYVAGGGHLPVVPVDPVDPGEPEGDTVTADNTGLNELFITEQGNLFVGTGIPGDEYYHVVSNDLIELGLTSHATSNWTRQTIEGSHYTIQLLENAPNWNVTWSVGYKGAVEGTLVSDVYDVEIIFHTNADGSEDEETALRMELVHTGENYVMQNVSDLVEFGDVTDSGTDPESRCAQNSFRRTWIAAFLTPSVPDGQPVLGTFVTELRATHKVSGNVLSNKITSIALPAVVESE
jgi:hypothetical protein